MEPPPPAPRLILDDLLIHVLKLGGSDLHLTKGAPPTVRLRGEMQVIEGYAPADRPSSCRARCTA